MWRFHYQIVIDTILTSRLILLRKSREWNSWVIGARPELQRISYGRQPFIVVGNPLDLKDLPSCLNKLRTSSLGKAVFLLFAEGRHGNACCSYLSRYWDQWRSQIRKLTRKILCGFVWMLGFKNIVVTVYSAWQLWSKSWLESQTWEH